MWGFSCLPRRKFSLRSCLHKVYSVSHVPTYLKRAPVKLFFFPCSYGDRSPIGQLGRIFAVGWVLTGLVIIAITVAALTTALTEITAHRKTTIYGSKVAITWLRTDRYLSPGGVGVENLFGRITQFSGGTGGDQSSPAENTGGTMESWWPMRGHKFHHGTTKPPLFLP